MGHKILLLCLQKIAIYKHRRRSRLALADLSDAHLIDIGLTPTQAEAEIKKAFWIGEKQQQITQSTVINQSRVITDSSDENVAKTIETIPTVKASMS